MASCSGSSGRDRSAPVGDVGRVAVEHRGTHGNEGSRWDAVRADVQGFHDLTRNRVHRRIAVDRCFVHAQGGGGREGHCGSACVRPRCHHHLRADVPPPRCPLPARLVHSSNTPVPWHRRQVTVPVATHRVQGHRPGGWPWPTHVSQPPPTGSSGHSSWLVLAAVPGRWLGTSGQSRHRIMPVPSHCRHVLVPDPSHRLHARLIAAPHSFPSLSGVTVGTLGTRDY